MARLLRCFAPNMVPMMAMIICACLLSGRQELAAMALPGTPSKLPVNEEVKELARYAIHQYNVVQDGVRQEQQDSRNEPASLALVKVVSATQQAVHGIMYVLRFEAATVQGSNCLGQPRLYEAKVWRHRVGDIVSLSLEGFATVSLADDHHEHHEHAGDVGDVYGYQVRRAPSSTPAPVQNGDVHDYHVRRAPSSAPAPVQNGDVYGYPVRRAPSYAPAPVQNGGYLHLHHKHHVDNVDGHRARRGPITYSAPTPVQSEHHHLHPRYHPVDVDVPAPAPCPHRHDHHHRQAHRVAPAPAPVQNVEYHRPHMM